MHVHKLTRLALVVALAMLSACDGSPPSGPLEERRRELEPFDSIDLKGAVRLEVEIGEPRSLIIEGPQAVIDRLRTEVHGNTLHIRSKPRDWIIGNRRSRVTLKITLPRLASLQVEGGNDVRLSGLDGGLIKIAAAGAAHIEATGRVDQLIVGMAGAGHVDLGQLIADQAKVTLDGVGSVIVHPKDTLDATMNGVGAILYTGNPRQVNTRMNGLGTIGRQASQQAGAGEDGPRNDADVREPADQELRKTVTGGSTEVI